ncbi:histidine-containing phosphotransfer protein 2-like [Triticum dicoccoides]|uniref:histidine-containing phosphotransfer protein 2-like n=1 Tax=Triticum dicoccoides TaxID=85692 RepID=UPI000E7D1554|nr:histidine-containing phosphotransfer protein 2-like [Triticum dicoccoides]
MSAAELRSQLNTRVSYMYAMGILDEYYQELQPPQDEGFVPEVINMFLHEADMMLNDITSLLNLPVVDFEMVGELVHQLKEYSGSVGARKVNLACVHFQQFYEGKSKERCLMALNVLRNEFYDVRDRLQTIMQLEKQIATLGPN